MVQMSLSLVNERGERAGVGNIVELHTQDGAGVFMIQDIAQNGMILLQDTEGNSSAYYMCNIVDFYIVS